MISYHNALPEKKKIELVPNPKVATHSNNSNFNAPKFLPILEIKPNYSKGMLIGSKGPK